MSLWFNIHKMLPGISGDRIHVVSIPVAPLMNQLMTYGFKLYTIDGTKVLDEESFFETVAQTFEFPAYFGKNWNAWDECFGDFGRKLTDKRIAIIWKNFDQSLVADIQTVLTVVCEFHILAFGAARKPDFNQIEVFLVGQGSGFNTKLNL